MEFLFPKSCSLPLSGREKDGKEGALMNETELFALSEKSKRRFSWSASKGEATNCSPTIRKVID